MVVYFSFDDGRDDFYQSFKILKKYGLTGTFHITTGFVDGSFLTDDFGKNRKPLTVSQIKEMYDNGMEICSHGDKHITETIDFKISIEKLKKWGILYDKYGFSVPNSNCSESFLKSFFKENQNELKYIRVGRSKKCYTFFNKIMYIMFHCTKMNLFYNLFNKHNLIFKEDTNLMVNSLVIKKDIKSKTLIKFLKKYENKNCSLVIMLHSVVDKPSNEWEWSIKNFEEICQYIEKNKLISCRKLVDYGK